MKIKKPSRFGAPNFTQVDKDVLPDTDETLKNVIENKNRGKVTTKSGTWVWGTAKFDEVTSSYCSRESVTQISRRRRGKVRP